MVGCLPDNLNLLAASVDCGHLKQIVNTKILDIPPHLILHLEVVPPGGGPPPAPGPVIIILQVRHWSPASAHYFRREDAPDIHHSQLTRRRDRGLYLS